MVVSGVLVVLGKCPNRGPEFCCIIITLIVTA